MEQHPVPRQITTFEFKLIGFMTLKQFIYLVIFLPIAYVILSVFPIPILNIFLAFLVGFTGVALAFIPINDRPLDIYIKNFIKRIVYPTQYYYQKINIQSSTQQPAQMDQKNTNSHIETNQKLTQYLNKNKTVTNISTQVNQKRKEEIKNAFDLPIPQNLNTNSKPLQNENTNTSQKQPFLKGVSKNKKQTPLPGILIYINDQNNNPLRLLKTNTNGTFESYNNLPEGVYDVEMKDPNDKHLFDRVKINLKNQNPIQFEFFSKELI